MQNILPKNNYHAQFYFYGDIDAVENRAYFAGPHNNGSFYAISYPVNKKTGRAWQAGRNEGIDFASREQAIDFIKRTTGNF